MNTLFKHIFILIFIFQFVITVNGQSKNNLKTRDTINISINKIIKTKIDTGLATFYGNMWHGRRTASGLPYHKDSLTCAHRNYPFGTKLKVTNLKNGKTVIVKVTDRGPHVRYRIIDLSTAAAKQISMIADGVVKVSVEFIP
jgi:rare lipoprotein A